MKEDELVLYLGSVFNLVLETFLDKEFKKGKIRVRPILNQEIPSTLHVAYSRRNRELFLLGTQFKLDVRLCRKATGKFYLNPVRKKELLPEKKEKMFYSFGKQLLLPF